MPAPPHISGSGTCKMYTVQAGDSLRFIAASLHLDESALNASNPRTSSPLTLAALLKLPPWCAERVVSGLWVGGWAQAAAAAAAAG